MCGIIGYVGKRSALPILLGGLKRLEYRGYDSAGVALLEGDTICVVRRVGKIALLEEELRGKTFEALCGIGHTRWATHGIPADHNAHPHTDCHKTLALVHNGIIENYRALRERLVAEGHRFLSETDSEVIAHLLEGDGPPLERILRTLPLLEGSYALCILFADEPGVLYGVRKFSPLILGVGEGECFLASDVPAFLEHTRQAVFLEDGEIVRVSEEGWEIFSEKGERLERKTVTVPWDPVSAERGGFKHFMLKEIHEEPRVFEDTIAGRVNLARGEVVFEELEDFSGDYERVVVVACGTACHAGMLGKMYLEDFVRLPVDVEYASEFRYRDPLVDEKTLVVAISQSGETADTLRAVELARKKGAQVLAVCNVLGSSLTRLAHFTVYTRAGLEIGVASTKAFLAQMTVLLLFALFWGARRGTLPPEALSSILSEIPMLPRKLHMLLGKEEEIHALAREFYLFKDFLYLGRGFYYPLALEGALKLKEISYIHAEGLAAGEMKHGPIALIEPDVASFVLVGQGERRLKVLGNIEEIKARRGKVIALCDEGDREVFEKADYVIEIPRTLEPCSPLLAVVPLQLFAYYVALEKGCDVDQPRNLAKSVTVE
ncbi:MAG: glutamine--fructose-6-phosphate transaminase (isomerizing) [Candidatus Caldatribacterium sp.]|nr:glutamine--fructose-6-phosphate transaminase (isomerizing) [Candidatus Caldatribacterium sp.]